MDSRSHSFGVSQSRLARLSNVGLFKVCTFEAGNGSFSLETEPLRQGSVTVGIDLCGGVLCEGR